MKFSIIPVTPFQQNCTLLICEKTRRAAVVDPGGDIDLILRQIENDGVTPESILVTHGHLDHVGAVADLSKSLSLPIYGPQREDLFWISSIADQCRSFGFAPCDGFQPDRWLNDGDVVRVGRESLNVIHCPGHTPGHVVFFCANAKLAVVGDVLFNGSIGRTDFPKGDYDTLIASIRNKLWPLGKDIAFIPGHGPMSTFGEEMRSNPFVGTGV